MNFDPRESIAKTLRSHGWAVRCTLPGTMDISRPGCDALDGSDFWKMAHVTPEGPADSALSWASAIKGFCQGDALKVIDGDDAKQLERFVIDSLAENMRMAGIETIKQAYSRRHPEDPLLRAMNPVTTFDDALHPGGAINSDMYKLTGIMDDVTIDNTFEIMAEHFGIDPKSPESHWRFNAPILPKEVIEPLQKDASFLNPASGKLAVSYMGGDYEQGEIRVYSCDFDTLSNAYHAFENLTDQPVTLRTQDIVDNMEPTAVFKSVEELNASGFFERNGMGIGPLVPIDDYLDLDNIEHALGVIPTLEDVEEASRTASSSIETETEKKPENGDIDW